MPESRINSSRNTKSASAAYSMARVEDRNGDSANTIIKSKSMNTGNARDGEIEPGILNPAMADRTSPANKGSLAPFQK